MNTINTNKAAILYYYNGIKKRKFEAIGKQEVPVVIPNKYINDIFSDTEYETMINFCVDPKAPFKANKRNELILRVLL